MGKKLELLHPNADQVEERKDDTSKDNGSPLEVKLAPNHCNGVGSKGQAETIQKVPRRTKSMINRRKSDINSPTEKEKELEDISNRDPSLNRAHIVSVRHMPVKF